MATSGTMNYSITTLQIITEALELLGVLGEGEGATDAQVTSSMRTLNMMIKAWQADGLNLFSVEELTVPVVPGKSTYRFQSELSGIPCTSSPMFDNQPSVDVSNNVSGTLDTAINAYAGWGILITAPGYHFGGEILASLYNTDMSTLVTVVGGISLPAGDYVVYLSPPGEAAPITDDLSSAKPKRVLEAYYAVDGDIQVPLDIISRKEYYDLSTRDTAGVPNQLYFDPQRDYSEMHVWPTGQTGVSASLILSTQRTLEDFTQDGDEPDYPQEWFMPLAYNLARSLAPKYGTPQMDYARIMQQARELYQTVRDNDTEMGTSMYLSPDISWGG